MNHTLRITHFPRLARPLATLGLSAALLFSACGGPAPTEQTAAPSAPPANTVVDAEPEQRMPEAGLEEQSNPEEPTPGDGTEEEEEEEDYTTGDASLDDPLNEDGIGETELLVVSFGTSFNDSRRLTIGAIERAIAAAFPELSVRRGFTSQIVIDHVARRDSVTIDNVGDALDRAQANGVKRLVVQPTHLMDGFEYHDLAAELAERAGDFEAIALGKPILSSEEDFRRVAEAIVAATRDYADGETAIVFMGHGTEADSNGVYARMQETLDRLGADDFFIGTVEATPTVEDVLEAVQEKDYRRVVLEPLMIVAGDHANNDMAGGDPDSWKSVFSAAGYEVECLLRGLGELEEIQALLVDHAAAAVAELEAAEAAAPAGDTASGEDTATEPRPVTAADLAEGVYPVEMLSSSSMFRADHVDLKVSEGTLAAILYMSSDSYLWLYPGTAEEAAAADETDYIPLEENDGELHSFTLPVDALNIDLPCAAYSVRREQWYDRTLVFFSASLPPEAFLGHDSRQEAAPTADLADGTYTVEAALSGGSGKASIASPLRLTVSGGSMTAELAWSSPNYDYMIVGDAERLLNEAEPGEDSRFTVPVDTLTEPLTIIADTTAMSQPHEITYTLVFDLDTLAAAE